MVQEPTNYQCPCSSWTGGLTSLLFFTAVDKNSDTDKWTNWPADAETGPVYPSPDLKEKAAAAAAPPALLPE